MSTYAFGLPCSECGTHSGFFFDWCRVCRYTDSLGLTPDWLLLWLAHLAIFVWALEFELKRYGRIKQLVEQLRPKMPGFHKFRSDHRPRVAVILATALLEIFVQTHYLAWALASDDPTWVLRWLCVLVFFMVIANLRVFFGQPRFYCQDPAKVQQSISCDSAKGPFYLYRNNDWRPYSTLEALIQTLPATKPKSH